MTLRARARLVGLVSALVSLTLLGLLMLASRERTRTELDLALADSLAFETTQLRTALFGYLLQTQSQPRAPVEAQFRVLGDLLERTPTGALRADEQTRYAWEGARHLAGDLGRHFADSGDAGADPGFAERDRRTAELILMDTHSLILFARQLRYRTNALFIAAGARVNLMLALLVAGMSGLGLTLFLVFDRAVLAPIDHLRATAVRIARGEPQLRLHSRRQDELGELATAFDQMLDQLDETRVSRDRLEAEMAERARIEGALRLSEERLQLAMEASRSFAFEWDVSTDRVLRSPSSRVVLGSAGEPTDDGTAQEYFQRLVPEDRQQLLALVGSLTPAADGYHTEYRLTRNDGEVITVEETARGRFDPAGRLQRLVGAATDITGRKRAETEVMRLNAQLEERVQQRTAELEAANRELESFAYAVSHDLRAPLRALSGFSQALLEDHAERLDEEARGFLDQIASASRRMGELIDGILTLSRSTRGELRRDPVDLSAMAGRLLSEHARAEPHRRVTWEVEPGLAVAGDEAMLEVVMSNLIDNAWKYTAKAPTATIRFTAEPRAGERWLSLADNGAGFDMAYAERLFQPFQRLHRQDEFPGIGIGLATVQRIIHRHGGTIEASGTPGGGATFRFTLPATTARPESS